MDVLLQNSKTALYLKRDLAWTARREDAFVFISSAEAIDFAYEHRLNDVQIILFFKDLSYSLVVPFQPEHGQVFPGQPNSARRDRPGPA